MSVRFQCIKKFNEEILGEKEWRKKVEEDPNWKPSQQISGFEQAEQRGDAALYFLGMGCDPATLQLEILTALVCRCRGDYRGYWGIDPVAQNDEGRLRVPYELRYLKDFLDAAKGDLPPAQQACLQIANTHLKSLVLP